MPPRGSLGKGRKLAGAKNRSIRARVGCPRLLVCCTRALSSLVLVSPQTELCLLLSLPICPPGVLLTGAGEIGGRFGS